MANQATTNPVAPSLPTLNQNAEREEIFRLIGSLMDETSREEALIDLSKKREQVADLAPLLWHSFGTMAILLQEIICVYPLLQPPTLSASQSNRVCSALALLQCVASHPETRGPFLAANMPLYLYPFLHTTSKTRPFDYLRLTSLGVIGSLVKTDEPNIIKFLLGTEIIPLCLKIMEHGNELSKTVATFILQKILTDDFGLQHVCQTYERFSHVATILGSMVRKLRDEPSVRLLKHVIRCYLRLSENTKLKQVLPAVLPAEFQDAKFLSCLKDRDDSTTKKFLVMLFGNVDMPVPDCLASSSPTPPVIHKT